MGNEVFYGILTGFIVGSLLGIALAVCCFKEKILGTLLKPVGFLFGKLPEITLLLPVFFHENPDIILVVCLIATAGFMYSRTYNALGTIDEKIFEMAHVFRMPADRKFQYIYLPKILENLKTSAIIGAIRCIVIGIASWVVCRFFV